jgi:hypothetical protein
MTNLEVLCGVLRKIRRPDAAQILEDRTHEEWLKQSRANYDTARRFSLPWGGRTPWHILRFFSWGNTPEAHEFSRTGYWSPLYGALRRWHNTAEGQSYWTTLVREHYTTEELSAP